MSSGGAVCFRKNLPIGIKQAVPLVCRKVSISLGHRHGGREVFSSISVAHCRVMGKEFGDLGQGRGDGAQMTDTVGPGVPVERVSQHGLVSVYMCVRGCGCLSFVFL